MTLAIVSALHEELSAVQALVVPDRSVTLGGRVHLAGRVHGHDVIAVLSGIGKVAAACTVTGLITHFGVCSVVFTGVAGGLGPSVRRGDVVVGREFIQHDMDARPLFPRYEVPMTGCTRFRADPHLSDALCRAARIALPAAHVHEGLVISGDQFVGQRAHSEALQIALPDALAVEMEGAAIAQVCRDFGVPFAAVRTVSDRADDDASADFQAFIATVASPFSAAIVDALLRDLPRA